MKDKKPYRSRKMGLLLYPEDASHVEALERLKAYPYALIKHDRDKGEDGVLLKAHWHVVLALKNAVWNTALAKELGISPQYIQQIRSEEAALEYLIHANEPDKYQYTISDVLGPLQKRLVDYLAKDDTPEANKVEDMLEAIRLSPAITVMEFATFCAVSGYWDVFRRAGGIFIAIINERNGYNGQERRKTHQL